MRQHKIHDHEVAAVIAGVVSNGKKDTWETTENDLPKGPWAQKRTFKTSRGPKNRLLLEVSEGGEFKRIVPVEEHDAYLRDLIVRPDSDMPLARESGFHILKQRTVGVSRRDWAKFISKQTVLQRTQNIPVERRKGGVKIPSRGYLEMDLIEGKRSDIYVRFMRDDWYWLAVIDVLTGWFAVRFMRTKTAKSTARELQDILDEFAAKLGKPIQSISSDLGGEFKGDTSKLLKRRNIKQKYVDRANRIEHANQIFQRNFYRLYKLRRGTFRSLETQAVALVNNTRNKYTKKTPNEAVLADDKVLASHYNVAREEPEEKYRAREIKKGDRVRHLANIRKRLRGVQYKAYRGKHWSKSVRHVVEKKKIGVAFKYLVGGSWYDRDALLLVPGTDATTDQLVAERKQQQDRKHMGFQ